MSNPIEAISLTAETVAAPKAAASNYQAISEAAELVGGGHVYLSRNRKAVARWTAPDPRPPVFVTSEIGTVQQSIPYRAIGTALVRGIVPVSEVCNLYNDSGMIGQVLAWLLAEAPETLAEAVQADEAVMSLLTDDGQADDGQADDGQAEAGAEAAAVQAEDLKL